MAAIRWGSQARDLTLDDIRRIQGDFVSSARLARDAGFDIVYVYGAHGYLLTQFLSSWTNRRRNRLPSIRSSPRKRGPSAFASIGGWDRVQCEGATPNAQRSGFRLAPG